MSIYHLIEYSYHYSKISGRIWKNYRDDNIRKSELFKFNATITGSTPADSNFKDVGIAVPSKCLSNFC